MPELRILYNEAKDRILVTDGTEYAAFSGFMRDHLVSHLDDTTAESWDELMKRSRESAEWAYGPLTDYEDITGEAIAPETEASVPVPDSITIFWSREAGVGIVTDGTRYIGCCKEGIESFSDEKDACRQWPQLVKDAQAGGFSLTKEEVESVLTLIGGSMEVVDYELRQVTSPGTFTA